MTEPHFTGRGSRRWGAAAAMLATVALGGCAGTIDAPGPIAGATPEAVTADAAPASAAPAEIASAGAATALSSVTLTGKTRGIDPPFAVVKIFYATDRAKTGATEPNDIFGGGRGPLSLGLCEVSIPRDHRLAQLEGPAITRLEFRENPEKHIVLLGVKEAKAADYYRELGKRVGASRGRSALIFIHGYNVSFSEAARRTAQLAYDLAFDGAPIVYSWPSQGTVSGYVVDVNNSEWTAAHLERFLADVGNRSGVDNIYLIAHSLGTRATTEAIRNLAQSEPGIRSKIREVVLAAPDIDAEIFRRDIAPRIVTREPSITVYASASDKAMVASRNLHGYVRAGDTSGGIKPITGVELVDATNAETDFVGHAYYGDSKSIVSDLYELINARSRADKRERLEAIGEQATRTFRFLLPAS